MSHRPDVPSTVSAHARQAAERLLGRELDDDGMAGEEEGGSVAAAGERLLARLLEGMSRSFGAFGAVSLLARALSRAQATHPILRGVSVGAPGRGGTGAIVVADGLAKNAAMVRAAVVQDSLVVWLAQLVDLLGALIGDRLAETILEQSAGAPRSTQPDVRPGGGAAHDASRTVDES